MFHHPLVCINGVRIANFSSPHSFTFTDGTVLPGCDEYMSRLLMLEAEEVRKHHPHIPHITDIVLTFHMSQTVLNALNDLEEHDGVDIVLVPLPVMQALKLMGGKIGKSRVCRMADRVTKVIHHDMFCI